jgi:hypothetical protein
LNHELGDKPYRKQLCLGRILEGGGPRGVHSVRSRQGGWTSLQESWDIFLRNYLLLGTGEAIPYIIVLSDNMTGEGGEKSSENIKELLEVKENMRATT